MKFGKTPSKQSTAAVLIYAWLAICAMAMLPTAALAQYADVLYSPAQGGQCNLSGRPTQSLRTPLIPTAPNGAPYQSVGSGQPPPPGSGFIAPGVVGGDYSPYAPHSGMADSTHGNIFPTRSGGPADAPWMYAPGAGRRATQAGVQQGVYEYGQEQYGQFWGPGGKNGGTAVRNEGGTYGDAQGKYESGQEQYGQFWGPGGKNGGSAVRNEGGTYGDAQGKYESGQGQNGQFWGPGGKNGGSAVRNEGGAFSDAQGTGSGGSNNGTKFGPGGQNGGTESGPGAQSNGERTINDGGARGGSKQDGNGGEMDGQRVVNNGGPRSDAEGNGDRIFQHAQQPSRYNHQWILPTVKVFARYLVILGVVFSTVYVAIAAWSMVFGNPHGGTRVIGAVGGLLLLLAGYTIWKIVEMNTFHANSTGVESHNRDGSPQQLHNGPYTIKNGPQGQPFSTAEDPGN